MKTRELNEQEMKAINGGSGSEGSRLKVSSSVHFSARTQDEEESNEVRFSDRTEAEFSTED